MTTATTSGTRRTDQRELALHRNNFYAAKFTGPLLRWRDLTPDAQAFLTKEFIVNSRCVPDRAEDVCRCYAETMHGWGVMCPHPHPQRLYEGWRASDYVLPFEEASWFSCALCNTRVVNRDT